MNVELITRKDCLYCNMAKEVLRENGIAYVEHTIGENISRDEVIAKYPDNKVLPIVIIDENVVGTYAELLDYIFPAKED